MTCEAGAVRAGTALVVWIVLGHRRGGGQPTAGAVGEAVRGVGRREAGDEVNISDR